MVGGAGGLASRFPKEAIIRGAAPPFFMLKFSRGEKDDPHSLFLVAKLIYCENHFELNSYLPTFQGSLNDTDIPRFRSFYLTILNTFHTSLQGHLEYEVTHGLLIPLERSVIYYLQARFACFRLAAGKHFVFCASRLSLILLN